MKARSYAFTLVELLVTIAIITTLWAIAVIALSGYLSQSRDAVRTTDLSQVKRTLQVFLAEKGFVPAPDDAQPVVYSWALAWSAGEYGDNVLTSLARLYTVVRDPLTGTPYAYSVAANRIEFELGAATEAQVAARAALVPTASAASPKTALVTWTYNAMVLKTQTGSLVSVHAVPSLILASRASLDLAASLSFAINGWIALPYTYDAASTIDQNAFFDLPPIVATGATLPDTPNRIVSFVTNLKTAYSDPAIAGPTYSQLRAIDVSSTGATLSFGANIIAGFLGGDVRFPYCAMRPDYQHATFGEGAPTATALARQNHQSSAPCYYVCADGYTGDDCSIAPATPQWCIFQHTTFQALCAL